MSKKLNLGNFDDLISGDSEISAKPKISTPKTKIRKVTQEVEEEKFIKLKAYCLRENKKLKEVLGEAIDKIIENIDLEKL